MNAIVNVTWDGQNGDLPDMVLYDATDAEILRWAEEAVQNGDVPGITAAPVADLKDFVVDRIPAKPPEKPENRLMVRPKAPFGA